MNYLTYFLILASTLCTLAAQLMLKGVVNTPSSKLAMSTDPVQFMVQAFMIPTTWIALSIQVAGYMIWLFVLSREKMAVAFALSGSVFYLITALASWYFYSEKLSLQQTAGICLISAGVYLVASKGPSV